MPTTLRVQGDELRLKLGGLSTDEFKDAIQKARAIPGRTYDAEAKENVYPLTADNAMRLVHTIRVNADQEVLAMIRDHAEEVAGELAARIPENADLRVPWADRLFRFQRAGAAWLTEHPRAILADDMGLGKTIQSATAVVEYMIDHDPARQSDGRVALVVAPNSMKRPWGREVADWLGDAVQLIDGKKLATCLKQLEQPAPWTVVNWEKLRNPGAPGSLMPQLARYDYLAVIADEAHRAKNKDAQQTKALWKLTAPMQLALTGTPILNAPDELWAVLHWLDPESYPDYWRFYYDHVNFYEGYYGRVVTGVKNADALRFALRNTLVRRTKGQVLKDLPPKLPAQVIEVELKPLQRKLYRQAEKELWLVIEQALEEGAVSREAVAEAAEDPKRLAYMIPNAAAKITRLRQIISTPALLGGKDESAKLDAAQEIILDHREKQFVVFAHFKGTADRLAQRLRKAEKSDDAAQAFTGDTPTETREALVERFQHGDIRTLVATIKAGGQGITLTAASTAIFIERDWTPAYNQQAEDRLHRIGQEEPVQIIRLDAADTIDTGRIAPANRLKELIVASVLGAEGES